VTGADEVTEEAAAELYEDAPCGYLSTRMDGTILRVNRTFETLTGYHRDALLGTARFQELLAPGDRIYHDTHHLPMLHLKGEVHEIAVEVLRADGSRLPALVNAVLRRDAAGAPRAIGVTVFDATERRRYEQRLLEAGRRERDVAHRLQRGLLAGLPPSAPGLQIGIAYRPGVSDLEVGGDWYDAFWLDEGATLALVVGDVVGRGIEAATTMGQLRSAVRALAAGRPAPGALLDALEGYSRRHAVGRLATLVYADLELATGRLRFACAGHPPPVLVAPGAPARLLWEGRSTPLDARPETPPRGDGACLLPAGGAILLYTDGLIERRSRSLDEGFRQLAAEVDARRGVPAQELVQGLVRAMLPARAADDVCVLAARRRSG
jgi:sigma-B regulation protein RsbU (phosphoserine phosphatase)